MTFRSTYRNAFRPVFRSVVGGDSGGDDAVTPLDLGETFWMQPTSGDVTVLVTGDATSAATSGATPTYTAGPTYHAGTLGAVNFPSNVNGSRLYLPSVGGPFQDISKSWWVAGAFRVGSAPGNWGLCGNGASATTQRGFRILLQSAGTAVAVCDGTTSVTQTLAHRRSIPTNQWVSFLFEGKVNAAASTVTVRQTMEGYGVYTSSQAQKTFSGLTMAGAPFTPGLVIADTQSTKLFAFAGDIVMQGGELPGGEFFSEDIVWMLHNYGRSRIHADAIANNSFVKMQMAGAKDNGLVFSVRTTKPIRARVYDEATRTLQASSTLVSPTEGFSKLVVDGLTAEQEVEVQFEDADGNIAIREWQGSTTPTGYDINIGNLSCGQWYGSTTTLIETITAPFWIKHTLANKPHVWVIPGDWGYFDPDVHYGAGATIANMRERYDAIFTGAKSYCFHDHNLLILSGDDHQFQNDGDSTSAYIDVGKQMLRLMNPVENSRYRHATEGWDCSLVLGGYRIIMLDTRTGKLSASRMTSPAMRTWFDAEIAAAEAANQIPLISFNNIMNFSPDTPVVSEYWQFFPAELTGYWDSLSSVFGTAAVRFITFTSDVHMLGLANESQSKFDTAGLLAAPCMHVAGFNHSLNESKGTWDHLKAAGQNSYGQIILTDGGATVAGDMKIFVGNPATGQQGTTLSVTLTK